MTTKATTGKRPEGPQQTTFTTPTPEDVQAAYQMHTLIQMMYAQLATTNPWAMQMPMPMPPMNYWTQPMPPGPMGPMGGMTPTPQFMGWPPACACPPGFVR